MASMTDSLNPDDPMNAKQRLIDMLGGGAPSSSSSIAGLDVSPSKVTGPDIPAGGEPGGVAGSAGPMAGPSTPKSSGSGYGGYSSDNLPPGVDASDPVTKQILGMYQAHGVQPGGRGAGFTDVAYWHDHPDQLSRLNADLSGTGPDQVGPDGVGQGSGSGGGGDTSGLAGMLQGSGTSNISSALNNLGALGNSSLLQQLLAQLRGSNVAGVQ